MGKFSVSLPEVMSAFVVERVKSGGYADTSEYFRDLVRRDRERMAAQGELRRMLDEAEADGLSVLGPEDIWAEAEARHEAEHGRVSAHQTRGK